MMTTSATCSFHNAAKKWMLLNFQEQLGQDQQLVKDLWSIKSHNQQIHWELTVYAVFTSFMVSDIDI